MIIHRTARLLRSQLAGALTSLLIWCAVGSVGSAQTPRATKIDIDRGHAMLRTLKDELKRNYYDPSFHGLDVEARFREYDKTIDQAVSTVHVFAIVAQFLLDLNDSHTSFEPPQRQARVEHGWRAQMIGDTCYVVAVRPGSDAEAKGVRPGDIVHKIGDLQPSRADLWKIEYLINRLSPVLDLRVRLQSPTGRARDLDVLAHVTEGSRVTDLTSASEWFTLRRAEEDLAHFYRHQFYEFGSEVLLWKMPRFDLSEAQVDSAMGRAKNHQALILDLRNNSGGAETTLLRLIGHLVERDTKIGDLVRRKETKPLVAKSRRAQVFTGKVVVLVDSNSASAAEVLARTLQLEKRGSVVGDRTLGRVMRSKFHPYRLGVDTVIFYGASITDADIVMVDGKSLEGVGVAPDEIVLPTGGDMAAGRDPVLARAAELLGVKLDPAKAGTLFPIEWLKNDR